MKITYRHLPTYLSQWIFNAFSFQWRPKYYSDKLHQINFVLCKKHSRNMYIYIC